MNKKQFEFTPSGVTTWKSDVRAGGQVSIDQECAAIADDFASWFPSRFILNDEQIQFLEQIDALVLQSYGCAIQYALQNDVDIVLEKETESTSRNVKNSKVVIMEEKIERWRESNTVARETPEADRLTFKIFYT